MTEEASPSDLDRWLTAVQEAIREREEALYSARVLAEARQPHNMAVTGYADGYGLVFGPCGDTMEVFLRLDGRRITTATFIMTRGLRFAGLGKSMKKGMTQLSTIDTTTTGPHGPWVRAMK